MLLPAIPKGINARIIEKTSNLVRRLMFLPVCL